MIDMQNISSVLNSKALLETNYSIDLSAIVTYKLYKLYVQTKGGLRYGGIRYLPIF